MFFLSIILLSDWYCIFLIFDIFVYLDLTSMVSFTIGSCCLSPKHITLRSKIRDWLTASFRLYILHLFICGIHVFVYPNFLFYTVQSIRYCTFFILDLINNQSMPKKTKEECHKIFIICHCGRKSVKNNLVKKLHDIIYACYYMFLSIVK